MLQKIFDWYEEHHEIISAILFIVTITAIGIAFSMTASFVGALKTMHDMEVQLAAHGVEWALYTPIP